MCNSSPVEGADPGDSSLVYLCSALSREDGTFTFPSLASGEYTVVSFLHVAQEGPPPSVLMQPQAETLNLLRPRQSLPPPPLKTSKE